MKPTFQHLVVSAFAIALAGVASAQTTVSSSPMGFVSTTALGNSDTFIGLSMTPSSQFNGALSANGTPGSSTGILAFVGPNWTADQFANQYYVRFTSGALNGRFYTVTANDGNTLTVQTNGDDLSQALMNDTVKVIKYWTLETLFPKASQNTFVVSAGTLGAQRKSELLIPDLASAGINLAAGAKFFLTSSGWKKDASGFPDASNQILYPDTYIIIRHPTTGVTSTEFSVTGAVPTESYSFGLATQAAAKQDNAIALARPLPATLAESGLDAGFVASASTLGATRRDELFVYNNSVAQRNKSTSRGFFRVGSNWVENTTGFPNANNFVLKPGEAILIRKYQAAGGATAFALNAPNY